MRWVVIVLAAIEAGFMVFDGARALLVGDYITPRSGAYAGQLGPWADLVSAIGIPPRSTLMKWIFVAYGMAWLCVTVAFALRIEWSWKAMLVAAVGSLWYLVPGTVMSAVVIALLFVPAVRALS